MSTVDKNYNNIFEKFRNFTLLHGKQQRTTEQIHNVFFKFVYFIAGFFRGGGCYCFYLQIRHNTFSTNKQDNNYYYNKKIIYNHLIYNK